ncbi:MAG: glutamate--tRNA ligase [Candidatus Omnitrophica bacterium]|nr:glutamate--tRNA ligase [Candidatus Omnitrophota bacterium]
MKGLTSETRRNVSVRFAPSPTGHLHIGGVRTALYNWLYARQCNGTFYLRIEDTDRDRSKESYEQEIIDSLSWLGLTWDAEIVRQSSRVNLYRIYADQLIEKGLAYKVDETTDAVKFKVPAEKVSFKDLVYGTIEFDASQFDDIVIIRSDGYPTWIFACVVDDGEMKISHVIRGEDHISNTPRQILLARALGFSIPHYIHLPLIFGSDGTPLSKRHGTTALANYRNDGYVAEGLLNYLALLGWGPQEDKEFFRLNDLVNEFSFERANKTNAIFDEQKLKHINALHIKRMKEDDYYTYGVEYLTKQGKTSDGADSNTFSTLLKVYKDRIGCFSDLYREADYFFNEAITFDKEGVNKYLNDDATQKYLRSLHTVLSKCDTFDDEKKMEETVRALAVTLEIKAAKLIHPIRVSITGKGASPGIFAVMRLLGKEKVLSRIKYVIDNFNTIKSISLAADES